MKNNARPRFVVNTVSQVIEELKSKPKLVWYAEEYFTLYVDGERVYHIHEDKLNTECKLLWWIVRLCSKTWVTPEQLLTLARMVHERWPDVRIEKAKESLYWEKQ